jgi:ankyrin repeat protein
MNHDLPDLDAFFAESTPFHWAAMLGLYSTCKWLIDQGSSANRATETLGGPLRCAVLGESVLCDLEQISEARGVDSWHKDNRTRTIAIILDALAAIEGLDYRYEDTVLLKYALKIGEPEHVKLLLQNGSIVDRNCLEFLEEECESEPLPTEMQEILQAMSNDNFDPEDLPRATKLLHKFEETSTHAAKLLKTALQLHPKKLNGNTEDQNQTLRSVSRYGQYDLVAELLRRPDIEVDSKNPENGCTALHLACEAGHLEVVKLLVERGANVNALNDLSETPAFLAAEWGHVPVLTFLHHNGADLALAAAAEERDGRVLSHQAAIFNHVQVIRYLMKTEPILVQKTTRTVQGKTVLMCAALEGSIKTVEYILDACPDDEVVAESNDGCCALHFAVMSGKKKLVELLIRKTPNLNIKSKDGSNALHFAAMASEDYAPNANVVTALMEAGVDHLVRDEKGNLPGHLAARIGTWDSFSTLKRLIQADGDKCPWINEKSDEAKTLLQIMTTHRNFTEYSYDMISLLCSDPGIDLECLDSSSRTPLLHLASRFSQNQENDADSSSSQSEHSDPSSLMDAFEALVTRGANIHHTDNEGESALRILGRNRPSTYGFYAMECLLKQSASVITPNKYGKTALEIFFAKIDEKAITVKLSRSFFEAFCQVLDRVPDEYFERYQYQGWQPLSVAFRFGAADIILKLIDRGADVDKPDTKAPCLAPIQHMCLARVYDEALVDKILDRSKDINRRDTHGDSLLALACKQGHLVVIRSLLRHGVNLVTNDNGILALSAASFNGHNQIVELLIESGIDVNSRTGPLRVTPLMSAVEGGNLATVQSLLRKGADVNLKTTNDWNVAHFLAVRGNESYLEELLSTKLKWDLPARATMPSESPETALSGNNTPLHLAALHEFTSMIKFLFKHNLVPEIDVRNSLGATPLWVATAAGKLTAVKELLSHGADINAASLGGATPVPIAVALNIPPSVPANPPDFELLVTTLLDTGKFNFEVIDNRGRSVFHIAALFGSQQSLLALLSAVESTQSKDLINSLDNFQATPLKRAIERGDPDIISILTKAGAIVDLPSKEESLALDTAASILLEALRRGDEALLQHAIKEGADLNMKIPYCTLNEDGERHQCTPLVVALYGHYSDRGRIRSCPTIARFLIDKDVDINVKSCFNGLQPIHLAVAQELNVCVESLLSKGAVLADHKISPFHIAVMLGSETLCKLFLEHEMNQQGSKSGLLDSQIFAKDWKNVRELDQFWNNPFHVTSDLKYVFSGTALHIAACLDFPNTIVEWLLEQGADPNSVNQCLQTPLMYALHWGDDENTIQILLERQGLNIRQRDEEGLNAVHYAISSQYLSRVEKLEDFGFNFQEELNDSKIEIGYLAFAMREGAMEAAEFFIKKGHDPNFRARPGRLTPLQMATGTTKAEEFLEKYAPEVDIGDDIEGTLLNSACTDSSLRAVELLLAKARSSGANMCEYVNKGCTKYGTPLYAAAYRGKIEVMQILLDAGADINKCDGGQLGTPLDAACALERVEAVKFLFGKGAKIKTTKMTGPELCEEVKASSKLEEIRAVLSSGDLSHNGVESG